jgi:hypothetical protein
MIIIIEPTFFQTPKTFPFLDKRYTWLKKFGCSNNWLKGDVLIVSCDRENIEKCFSVGHMFLSIPRPLLRDAFQHASRFNDNGISVFPPWRLDA